MRSGKNIFTRGGRRDRLDTTQTKSALRRAAQMTVWYLAVLIAFLPWRQGVCATDVTGNIDGVYYSAGQYHVNGWACATTLTQSISVDLYVGGPAGTGTMVGRYLANAPSESAVATACQSTGANYRFSITITDAIATQYYGQAIYVHGISPVGGANNLLNHSGWYTVPRPIEIVTYYHTDRLGSMVMSSDASGTITSTVDYRPYGEVVQGGKSPAPGYTGQYEDPATGLTYMRARYYDTQSTRFLSVDPISVSVGDVLGFNRYMYASANPSNFTDPSGANPVPTLPPTDVIGYHTAQLSSNGPDVFGAMFSHGGASRPPGETEPPPRLLDEVKVTHSRLPPMQPPGFAGGFVIASNGWPWWLRWGTKKAAKESAKLLLCRRQTDCLMQCGCVHTVTVAACLGNFACEQNSYRKEVFCVEYCTQSGVYPGGAEGFEDDLKKFHHDEGQ